MVAPWHNTLMTKKSWTKEEESFLIENYSNEGGTYCSEKLDRTKASVRKKAATMGLQSTTIKKWTKEEDQFLLENYPEYGYDTYKYLVNRTKAATARRASILGVQAAIPHGKLTHQEYLRKLEEKGIENMPIEEYAGRVSILHKCINDHTWLALPTNILNGSGCPSCAVKLFNPTKQATLYYIKILSQLGIFYKVGITNRTVSKRFSQEEDLEIIVLYEEVFDSGYEAKELESSILKEFKHKRLKNSVGVLKGGGNTELFPEDVLGLDTEKAQ